MALELYRDVQAGVDSCEEWLLSQQQGNITLILHDLQKVAAVASIGREDEGRTIW